MIHCVIGSLLMLLVVLLVVGAGLCTLVVWMMARTLLRPPRMSDRKAMFVLNRVSPADLDLPFEPMSFHVVDPRTHQRLRLTSWWIPADRFSDRCVVLIHGYADAKIGGIAWAPMFRRFGFNCLAIDLRGHGDADGINTTAGFFERHDVDAILTELRTAHPLLTRELFVFGVSLGAAVAVNVAAMRDDLAGVILDCPFADYRHAVRAHAAIMRMPLDMLQMTSVALAERLSGADFRAVRPVDRIVEARCPVLLIHSDSDPFVPADDMRLLHDAMHRRPEAYREIDDIWVIEGAPHVMGLAHATDAYVARVRAFIERAVKVHRSTDSSPAGSPGLHPAGSPDRSPPPPPVA
jgi:pimeloyl-ACP methyl ester carboxylesterase